MSSRLKTPQGGDHTRAAANRRSGFSASFLNNNRNKRSIVLDLKAPSGVAVLKRLVAGADVFVQNFRPGVIDRMGFGEDGGPRARARHHLCLDQRLRRPGTVRRQAGIRSADPVAVRPGDSPGRLRPGAAAAGAHHRARQADRRRGGAGDHRRAAGTRADREGPARAAVHAGRGGRVPLGLRHGQPDVCRRRTAAAGGRQLHRPDLPDRRRLHQRGGADRSRMDRTDPRAGSPGMAGRSTLPHAGAAAEAHQRAAGDDPGGAADAGRRRNGWNA